MDKHPFSTVGFFKKACFFEATLILVAIFLGWIAKINLVENLHFSESAIACGVIGTMPLLLLLLALEQIRVRDFGSWFAGLPLG